MKTEELDQPVVPNGPTMAWLRVVAAKHVAAHEKATGEPLDTVEDLCNEVHDSYPDADGLEVAQVAWEAAHWAMRQVPRRDARTQLDLALSAANAVSPQRMVGAVAAYRLMIGRFAWLGRVDEDELREMYRQAWSAVGATARRGRLMRGRLAAVKFVAQDDNPLR